MSTTNLKNVNGVFKKVILNNKPYLKFGYFSHIEGNNTNKLIRMYTIKDSASESAKPNECIISSDCAPTTVTSTFETTHYKATDLSMQYFAEYSFKPYNLIDSSLANVILTHGTDVINCLPMASSYTTLFYYILFKCDFGDYTFNGTEYYCNYVQSFGSLLNDDSIIPITSSNTVSLGNNFYVTTNHCIQQAIDKTKTAFQKFDMPHFAVVSSTLDESLQKNILTNARDIELHDIAISYYTN